MNLVNAILAESDTLPKIDALGYQYVIAGNGLFIRAEDSRMSACIPIVLTQLHGLADIEPHVILKVPRVPNAFLRSILESARRHLPNEAMYQLWFDGNSWRVSMPAQSTTPTAARFQDNGATVIDLHSHGAMDAFFSPTDDGDERGFRLYVVIGNVNTERPTLCARVGVYGHHWNIAPEIIFESIEPFVLGTYSESEESQDDLDTRDDLDIYSEPGIAETASGLLVARYGDYK